MLNIMYKGKRLPQLGDGDSYKYLGVSQRSPLYTSAMQVDPCLEGCGVAAWSHRWEPERSRRRNEMDAASGRMRTRWLSPSQASGVAAQVLQSGMLYPARYDVYDSKDCEEADKVVRGVVFRSLTPHMFVPNSAVNLPMSMGGLGVEVMEDLINRELVTAWARDLESEHTATRETTRHVTRLVETLRDDLARQNGGGPLHSDVIRGYGRAGYGIGRSSTDRLARWVWLWVESSSRRRQRPSADAT